MTNRLQTDLHDALGGQAMLITPADDAWAENTRRVRRSKRQRRTATATGTTLVLILAAAAVALAVPDAGGPPAPQLVPAATTAPTAGFNGVNVAGRTARTAPVPIGTVNVNGQRRTAVLFLTDRVGGGDPVMDGSGYCTALQAPDGTVSDPAECRTLGGVPGDPLLGSGSPLQGFNLPPAGECAFGPLGNLVFALTTELATSADLLATVGAATPMRTLPGTEQWPVNVYTANIPRRTYLAGFKLSDAGGKVLRDDSTVAGTGVTGCPQR